METTIPNRNPLGYAPIGQLMRKFSIPSIITLIVTYLYNIVDQIFIGQGVGYLGNAATNVIFPLTVAIAVLLGDGGAAFMNLNLGQGNKTEASKSAGNVATVTVVSALALTIICIIFLKPLCGLLGATADSIQYSLDYGLIIILGFPFTNFATSVSSLIRADGSPRYSMAVMLSGAITNTILDPLFIFGFGWGVKGAAWATVIGQAISAVLCVSYFSRFRYIDFSSESLKVKWNALKKMFLLGISSFITQIAVVIVTSANNIALTTYGAQSVYGADIPLAALGITMKVNQILMGFCIGIAAGCAPIISFNCGAQQVKRVKQTILYGAGVSVLIMALATICYEVFPLYIVKIFGTERELYMRFAVKTFRIYLCLAVFNGFQVCIAIFFQALGKPLQAMLVSVSRQVVFYIPVMLLLSSLMGVEGILWAGPAGDALTFILVLPLILFQFKKFKEMEG
ncbi:MAG: MATE family efflux transporter [Treponema sp.]|nr:MATE family efflux transporter [Treponema sp.]